MTESVKTAAKVKGEVKQDSQNKTDIKFDTSDYNKKVGDFFNNMHELFTQSPKDFYPKMLEQMKVFSPYAPEECKAFFDKFSQPESFKMFNVKPIGFLEPYVRLNELMVENVKEKHGNQNLAIGFANQSNKFGKYNKLFQETFKNSFDVMQSFYTNPHSFSEKLMQHQQDFFGKASKMISEDTNKFMNGGINVEDEYHKNMISIQELIEKVIAEFKKDGKKEEISFFEEQYKAIKPMFTN